LPDDILLRIFGDGRDAGGITGKTRKEATVVVPCKKREVLRVMLEVEVMENRQGLRFRMYGKEAVRRKEKVRLKPFQQFGDRMLKPPVVKERMTRLWKKDLRGDVV
jgi:hypothetical protein